MADSAYVIEQAGRLGRTILQLLPGGRAITKAVGSHVEKLATAIGVEPARVLERAQDLLREAIPTTADELLPEWEETVGLPDACAPAETLEERQALVGARLVGLGGHAPGDYEAVASALLGDDFVSLGYERYFPFTCLSACTDALYQDEWAHTLTALIEHYGDAPVNRLECEFNRRKRGHSLFLYQWSNLSAITVHGEKLTIGGSYLTVA